MAYVISAGSYGFDDFLGATWALFSEAADRTAATYFLLLRQMKVSKEKATLLSASLWLGRCPSQAGNLRCSPAGCAAELAARLQRFAQTAAAS